MKIGFQFSYIRATGSHTQTAQPGCEKHRLPGFLRRVRLKYQKDKVHCFQGERKPQPDNKAILDHVSPHELYIYKEDV